MQHYDYYDLRQLDRYLIPMLLIAAMLTIFGLTHGLHSLQQIAQLDAATPLTALDPETHQMLAIDGWLRFSQIALTLIVVTFFFVVWLYFAARNLVAIYAERHQNRANSIIIFTKLMLGVFFALRMMRSMWRRSFPAEHDKTELAWLVPTWWALLISANICKVISVYTLNGAETVADWGGSYSWMIAAFCLYFPLYFLTWWLARAMSKLQWIHWEQRQEVLNEILGEGFHVGGRGPKRHWRDPYTSAPEALGLLWRNIRPSRRNLDQLSFTPRRSTANEIEPEFTVGFGGDLLMMFGNELRAGDNLKSFFAECDAIILNMEGVVTNKPKKGPDQKHSEAIMDQLAAMYPPEQTWLSLANNHAADFGPEECLESDRKLQARGFRTLGLSAQPWADLHPLLRVIAGTQWSNRDDEGILYWLDQHPEQYRREDAFNLLLPHWNFEMECYPRPWGVTIMQRWLKQFDGVIGHHSHTPQPITMEAPHGINTVAAYSLGGFCSGFARRETPVIRHYGYGLVVRITIGRLKSNPERIAIGQIDWEFVECFPNEARTEWTVDTAAKSPYFDI